MLVEADHTVWWLAIFAVILAFAAYGLARLVQDTVTGWREMRRDKSEDLEVKRIYTTQTGMAHIRKCSAYARADTSKCTEQLVRRHCQRDFATEVRQLQAHGMNRKAKTIVEHG